MKEKKSWEKRDHKDVMSKVSPSYLNTICKINKYFLNSYIVYTRVSYSTGVTKFVYAGKFIASSYVNKYNSRALCHDDYIQIRCSTGMFLIPCDSLMDDDGLILNIPRVLRVKGETDRPLLRFNTEAEARLYMTLADR